MARNGKKSRIVEIGGKVSEWVSNLFAHPYMQIGVIAFCISWFVLKLDTNLLTAALSILAITLTQMVLNRQTEREVDDRRRDVAMHAKLDELLIAMTGARDEMAGIEDLEEEEIVELKENIQDTFEVLNEELEERAEEKGARAAVAS
jgi:low affinity Fe/Cu permease